jgi:hypothetical protein
MVKKITHFNNNNWSPNYNELSFNTFLANFQTIRFDVEPIILFV